MTSVLAASVYPMRAAGPRLRLGPVIRELRRSGVETSWWSLLRDQDLEAWLTGGLSRLGPGARALPGLPIAVRHSLGCRVLLLQREFLPADSLWLERGIHRRLRPIIWDVDDALWARGAARGSVAKYRWLARHATEVWAGNATVADWATRAGATQVSVVPTPVDVPPVINSDVREEKLLVWVGTPSTGPFLERLVSDLGPSLLDWRLLVVGATVKAPKGVLVEQRPWSPEAEADALRRATVGLYPLDLNHPAVFGKSALKCILYMAHGIPVIATSTPSNRAVMEHGVEGFFASTRDEWLCHLSDLRESGQRQRMSAAGHRRALRDFDATAWGARLAERLQRYL